MTYATPHFESKICPPDQLTARSALLARPLVFTNGCFDILHRGHVTYLAQAAALGSSMIVALNTDASVKRLGKGDDRPVNALEDRLAVMASLACVTLVTWSGARGCTAPLPPGPGLLDPALHDLAAQTVAHPASPTPTAAEGTFTDVPQRTVAVGWR